ncbi:MAG: hypothetical protein CBC35_03315 [Planctomycetes bacterium TMED75]|nr:hypothetical protein [Planctomycetaceae bacterium]OUU94928.1 MAG: hypothetical protein CBC35_03315 [Planctomycetes bacterium TMED75]
MSLRLIAGRILCPLLLLFLVVTQLAIGGNALPTWLAVIAQRMNQDPLTYLRILIMLESAAAFSILFFTTNRKYVLSQTALILVAFVSLAECAAAVRSRELSDVVIAAIFLAIALALEFILLKPDPSRQNRITRKGSRAPLKAVGTVLIILMVGIAANASIAPRTLSEGAIAQREVPSGGGARAIEMTPTNWIGRSIRETPIAQFVPDVIDILGEDGILVLYNPRCGTCHDLFELYFSAEEVELPIVALEVPPADNALLLESEYADQVNCPSCEFMKLPGGPMWLVGVPYVIRVVDETITCVGKDGPEDCLEG